MSTTVTLRPSLTTTRTMAATTMSGTRSAPRTPTPSTNSSNCACPSCGLAFDLPPLPEAHAALVQAQIQIAELKSQVRMLNQKAAAAIDRWADYEDELSRLRAGSITSSAATTTISTNISSGSPRSSFLGAGANRISALLGPKSPSTPGFQSGSNSLQPPVGSTAYRASRSTSELPLDTSGAATRFPAVTEPTTNELIKDLLREKKLRAAAEAKVDKTSREVEELSVTLFEQANEMVATERRARAELEDRVSVLEQRDEEKKQRLGRLEGALGRLDRVQVLLEDGQWVANVKTTEPGIKNDNLDDDHDVA